MKVFKMSFLLIILFLGTIYFILDGQLFYYGKSDLNIYGLLPMKVKPEFINDFDQGFTLWDEYGFSLVGRGNKYSNSDLVVNSIVKYGFNYNELIVLVDGENGKKYIIECSKNRDKKFKREILITVFSKTKYINLNEYKWIEIKNNDRFINTLELIRNYILFISIGLSFILLVKSIKKNR